MSAPIVDLSSEDKTELRRFMRFLRRRAERPEEPAFVTYGDFYGEVVFEDKAMPPEGEGSDV